MKIYACIPTFGEAGTIGNVTTLVDRGLRQFCSAHLGSTAKIINIDSASEDGTTDVFRGTDTHCEKLSVTLPKPRGKGKNLIEFMRIARIDGTTHCLTIDADLTSLTAGWINALLDPLVSDRADFVTPSYERSRFEGSTTNHFAYPVVFAATGLHVRQPIGGDFAFTSKLLDTVGNLEIPDAAQYYGIDIYLTLAALTRGLRHQQVALGQKIHGPSFHKLQEMFPQIAAATISLLRQTEIRKTAVRENVAAKANIIQTLNFGHKEAAKLMRADAQSELRSVRFNSWGWVPASVQDKLFSDKSLSSSDWIEMLASWLRFGLQNKSVSADLLGTQLLPFFVLRATRFWFLSETMSGEETEREIGQQALMFYEHWQEMP